MTKEVLPHLLGEMRIVLIPCMKLAISRSVSFFLSVKCSPEVAMPNLNGSILILLVCLYAFSCYKYTYNLKTKRSLSKKVLSKRPLGNLQGGGRGHLVGYLLYYKC